MSPEDRKLPPLSLSPGSHIAGGLGTPGSTLWNSLGISGKGGNMGNTNSGTGPAGPSSAGQDTNSNLNQFISLLRKTGLTPNESNLRSGLTPGGIQNPSGGVFNFGNLLPGLTTPGALLTSPITPGLSSLLGMPTSQHGVHASHNSLSHGNLNVFPNNHVEGETGLHYVPGQNHSMNPPKQEGAHNTQPHVNDVHNSANNGQHFKPDHAEQPTQNPEANAERKKSQLTEGSYPSSDSKGDASVSPGNKRSRSLNISRKLKKVKSEEDTRTRKGLESDERPSDVGNDDAKRDKEPSEEEKRKNFLERNRVAASKCRQRKKQLMQKMEDELAFFSTGYRELAAQVTLLRELLNSIRNILHGHKDCPVLISSLGGYEQVLSVLNQSDYNLQMSVRNLGNLTSMPSTIPTTLIGSGNQNGVNMQENPYALSHNNSSQHHPQQHQVASQVTPANHATMQTHVPLRSPHNHSHQPHQQQAQALQQPSDPHQQVPPPPQQQPQPAPQPPVAAHVQGHQPQHQPPHQPQAPIPNQDPIQQQHQIHPQNQHQVQGTPQLHQQNMAQVQQVHPAPQNNMQPGLPMHITSQADTSSSGTATAHASSETVPTSTSLSYQNVPGHVNAPIASHHSLSDLPAMSAVANQAEMTPIGGQGATNNGELRVIHSMSNLANMNGSTKINPANANFSRNVNSMVDLQNHYAQNHHHPHATTNRSASDHHLPQNSQDMRSQNRPVDASVVKQHIPLQDQSLSFGTNWLIL